MRIGILSINQKVDERPEHYVSKALATLICSERRYTPATKSITRTGVWVKKSLIQLQIEESIREIKDRFKKTKLAVIPIPKILPPIDSYDCIASPYPARDMSSYQQRNIKEIWGCTQQRWQLRIGSN